MENEKYDYGFLEYVADIAYDLGYRRLRCSNNSRAKIEEIIYLAKQFHQANKDTDWDEVDYILTISEFIDGQLKKHQKPLESKCPICGANMLVYEIVDSFHDFFSIQCTSCDHYWQDEKALKMLTGIGGWNVELDGDEAEKAFRFLNNDNDSDFYHELKCQAISCKGVFADNGGFVAFKNQESETFDTHFNASRWMRGEPAFDLFNVVSGTYNPLSKDWSIKDNNGSVMYGRFEEGENDCNNYNEGDEEWHHTLSLDAEIELVISPKQDLSERTSNNVPERYEDVSWTLYINKFGWAWEFCKLRHPQLTISTESVEES